MARLQGTRCYCEQVAQLYQGIDTDQAVWHSNIILWREIILDGDELRLDAVGLWARETLLQNAIAEGRGHAAVHTVVDRAQSMYHMRQFAGVLRLLDGISHNPSDVRIEFLRLHSAIMANLYQSDGDSMGADANWAGVAEGVNRAMHCLEERSTAIHGSELLSARYQRLREAAGVIENSRSSEPAIRLIDILAGLHGSRIRTLGWRPCC